jgi:hypothetical protein
LNWALQEVAYLGTRVHWTFAEVTAFDHRQRRHWVEQVAKLESGA